MLHFLPTEQPPIPRSPPTTVVEALPHFKSATAIARTLSICETLSPATRNRRGGEWRHDTVRVRHRLLIDFFFFWGLLWWIYLCFWINFLFEYCLANIWVVWAWFCKEVEIFMAVHLIITWIFYWSELVFVGDYFLFVWSVGQNPKEYMQFWYGFGL